MKPDFTYSDTPGLDATAFPVGLLRFSFDGKNINVISANEYYCGLFEMSETEYKKMKPDEYGFKTVATSTDFTESVEKCKAEAGSLVSFYFTARKMNGEPLYIGISARHIATEGSLYVFCACAHGIDWIVNRLSNYDRLTGLPKVHIFNDVAYEFMHRSGEGDCFALVSLDLNNFKLINEKIGTENGDKVLIKLGMELDAMSKGKGSCCRVFSDKYVMFIKFPEDRNLRNTIEKFIDFFTRSLRDEYVNYNVNISASAGIYFIEDTKNADMGIIMDKANIARKNAKAAENAQENSCMVYMEEMKTELSRALQITSEAERAIHNKEFIVYYQPKISLRGESVVGAEALVRWRKPDGTLIPPGMFLPYLEKSSFIKEVDFYVYDAVCSRIREEMDKGNKLIPISVNVSRLHLKDDDFVLKVKAMVNMHKIPPKYLEFELTENAFLDDEQRAVQILKELREIGFPVSIDDFGSGYSSLSLLKSLPVDILKLDRSFFGRNDLKENNAIVVSSIIDMANRMKINVICEGVETAEQVEFLKDTECDSVQGFYYARPIPQEELEDYVRNFNSQSLAAV
jgi:diguanylate cyclase (GGDEF)-like protein